MEIKSRRVPLTIPHSLDSILDRLVILQKRKKTQIITELLLEFEPILAQVADALEAIEQKKDPALILNAMNLSALAKIGEAGTLIAEVNQTLSKRCPDTQELPL